MSDILLGCWNDVSDILLSCWNDVSDILLGCWSDATHPVQPGHGEHEAS